MYIVVLIYISCRILFAKSLYKLHFLCYNIIIQVLSGYPARFQNKEVQNMENVKQKKIGLVLSGGGAKGAYEVGVWAALEQLGLTGSIDGIIGSSVGALNAVLFALGDLAFARDGVDARRDDLAAPALFDFDDADAAASPMVGERI